MLDRVRNSNSIKTILVLLWGFIGLGLIYLILRGEIIIPQEVQITSDLGIRLYSLSTIFAIIIGVFVFEVFRRRESDLTNIDIWDGLIFVIIPGIIGSRVYHVLTDFYLYQDDLWQVLAIWNGGVGFIGAVIGGVSGVFLFARIKKVSFESLTATAIMAVPIAHAVGRLGNLLNQELYGLPTDVPWGQYISPENRFYGLTSFEYYHPLFLYESIGNLVLFLLMFAFYQRGKRGWFLVKVYVVGYSVIRFTLDFLRINGANGFWMLTYAQWLALGVVGFLGWQYLRGKSTRS